MGQDDTKSSSKPGKRGVWLGVVITAAAIALGAVHAIWPHLKIDSVTVVLVVVALVPWIGGIVENIELPGGFKVGLREARQAAAKAQTQADQAKSTAVAALSAATTRSAPPVGELADEYVRMRRAMPPSPQRTSALDRLVGQLAVATADDPDFDFATEIKSAHAGRRLAALAFAYARPQPEMARAVLDVALAPDSNHEQYWALRALAQVAAITDGIDDEMSGSLRRLAERLEPGSSRIAAVEELLAAHGARTSSR